MLYQLPTQETLRDLLLNTMSLILAPNRTRDADLEIASKLAMARRMKDAMGWSDAAYYDLLHQTSLDYREMVAAHEANIPQDEPPCNTIPGFFDAPSHDELAKAYPREVENPLKPW